MIIRSSNQVSRWKLPRRFPVPKRFGVPRDSRIEQGRRWPAPAGAKRIKRFQIYRYDPESGML